MKEPIELSVVIPVYNAERYIAEAIESILNQTFQNFEVIIINDGSTDGTLQILQGFADHDERIRLVNRENKGLVFTLNEGIQLSSAPLIARMDADDISLPQRFKKQMDYLKLNPDCLLLGSRVIVIDEDGDEIREMGQFCTHQELDNGLLTRGDQLIYHPSVIFRKQEIEKLGGYREKYPHIEDLDLFLRVSETGKIENFDEPLLKYREHFMKVGHLWHSLQQKEIDECLLEAHERRNLPYKKKKHAVPKSTTELKSMEVWAWWALKAGNVKTARKYARRVFWHNPLLLKNWRLFLCSLRGY